ncbi:MAG: heparinase [Paenibacillus sp.]|nr:heparinase [Paenibacillus sp.]
MSENRRYLYPVYLVHEKEDGFNVEAAAHFCLSDPLWRHHSQILPRSDHQIHFWAFTEGSRFVLQLRYPILTDGQTGDLTLLFDPDHSRRKRHNAFQFRILEEGRLEYEEFLYEIEALEVPGDVAFSHRIDSGGHEVLLSLPFRLLRIESPVGGAIGPKALGNVLGFNVFRTINHQGEQQVVTWSGIKGDKTTMGEGTGDLLLTRGLDPQQVNERTEQLGAEKDLHFTKWEWRKVPAEIYDYITDKQRGLTVRMNAEDIQIARENAKHTQWGRKMKEEIIKIADFWAAKSDDELFDLVPVGNPRSLSPNQYFGDPLAGGKRTAYELCLERPYQYYNPATKTWWYNGMVIQNPTTGEDVVVHDDGSGFLAPEGFPNAGVRYMFTASYRHFLLAMLMSHPYCAVLEDKSACPETTGGQYAGAIPNLAYAYQLTGDRKYACKALLLIGRIAELVPYMNGNYGAWYYDTVQISEPTTTESHWLSNFFDAFDLVYDAIGETDKELAALFAGKPDATYRTRTKPFSVKEAVYDMIPQVLFSCEIERTRDADWSLRWLYLELIVASFMGSGKLMRSILYEGKHCLASKIRNSCFRDRRYIYDSFFYIDHICEQLAFMANNNYRFQDEHYFPDGVDMFENPESGLSQVMRFYSKLRCGNLLPMFGDNSFVNNVQPVSDERKKGKLSYSPSFEIVYRRMPSMRPVVGQVLAQYEEIELEQYRVNTVQWKQKHTLLSIQKHALLLLACAGDREEYRQHQNAGRSVQPSYLLQDSETSVFRAGTDPHNCKHVVLYGQPSAGHMHGDKLGLWIGAFGYHLLAGAGAYPYTWISPKWQAWEVHAAACPVVVVDGKDQEISYSRQKCHYEGNLLQVAGMENKTAYPGTHDERWCWVVQAPNRAEAYVVDVNYLANGGTFDYNTMGLDISFDQVIFDGIPEEAWSPMQGTLAGPDVPLYSQPGYGWMKALRKANVNHPVTWTFDYAEAALKVHTVPGGENRELICCLGERGGQETGKSRWEPFVMWRDAAEDKESHTAGFVTVLEPYEKKPFLKSVRPLQLVESSAQTAFRPVGIEIQYLDGHRDIVIGTYQEGEIAWFRDSEGREYKTDAQSLLLRYAGESLVEVEAVRYSLISAGDYVNQVPQSVYRGTITAVDHDQKEIQVELDDIYEDFSLSLEGQVALIDSPDYEKPSTYYMLKPSLDGKRFVFRTDMTFIKLQTDWKAPHKKRGLGNKQVMDCNGTKVYVDIKPGDSFHLFNSVKGTRGND